MQITKEVIKKNFLDNLHTMRGKDIEEASLMDKYLALGGFVKNNIYENWVKTNRNYRKNKVKQIYYFSMEFLIGRLIGAYLLNLGILDICRDALFELGINLDELLEVEPDAGLGNGGLGRLAACFLDSMASLMIPGHGCGIRYKYGHFHQKIFNGYQVELPDNWLKEGNIWEVRRPDKSVEVRFGGNVRTLKKDGKLIFIHENYETVLAVPYDTPIIGYDNKNVNTLRLWNAETLIKEDLNFTNYGHDEYLRVMEYKNATEKISQVLYPDDSNEEGKILRLKQEYFLVSAGIQSIIRTFKKENNIISDFSKKVAIHINDTHPALAVPELMRIFIDEEGLGWDEAWKITNSTISYTNHTIMSEALEKWPVDTFRTLLPRIYMIIEEINKRFCKLLLDKYNGNKDIVTKMAIISCGYVKMAHLAIVGSYSINGVSKLHTEILKNYVLKHFYNYYPYKFNNKTNGITHRRWLIKSNPELTKLINECINDDWIKYPHQLNKLNEFVHDSVFKEKLAEVKKLNKIKLSEFIEEKYDLVLDCDSIFDVQIKRIHAYKRQLLNAINILSLYIRLKENPNEDIVPRTFIFGGKAAPGYAYAKVIIKFINTIAAVINNDITIGDKLKVIFAEDYCVSLAELIIPAADVSEQISTAGKEASGTGNMKFMMNGALTLGTLDGANIEIRDLVGTENIVTFGLTEREVLNYYNYGGYNSYEVYNCDDRIKKALDSLINGFLGTNEFSVIYNSLLQDNDEFFVLKDFLSYVDAQSRVNRYYKNKDMWLKMCAINVACSGNFSSDRTIKEYASKIWKTNQVNLS